MSSPITSLFQPNGLKRNDSGLQDVIAQLENFKGFTGTSADNATSDSPVTVPTTLTFIPSNGSTCLSLYPRTRTFTYHSTISSTSCHAICDQHELWRITIIESESDVPRYTIERLESEGSAPVEVFRRCSVSAGEGVGARRMSSAGHGRKLSVGHFSSGLGGIMFPLSPIS